MIRGLVLDFDGLILDTESSIIEAYGQVHTRHGVPFDPEQLLNGVGHVDFAFDPWKEFKKDVDRNALEAERRRLARELDLLLEPLPGVVELLDAARAASLSLGIASNSSHAHVEGHLARLGLMDRFAFLACREDAPSPKPEPDLYRLVLNRFGFKGQEAIAFEDSHIGSLAAKRAGLRVVSVPNRSTARHDFSHADIRVASLRDCPLAGLLARFEGA